VEREAPRAAMNVSLMSSRRGDAGGVWSVMRGVEARAACSVAPLIVQRLSREAE
jgi:hypothetical protein